MIFTLELKYHSNEQPVPIDAKVMPELLHRPGHNIRNPIDI